MDDESDFERTIWVGKECFVYKIGPRPANGYNASDWKETDFLWRGRVRVTEQGDKCDICLEDPNTGNEFARCIVNDQLDKAVERVVDSSRYFVLRVTKGDKNAYIGMGFQERNDAFDFNVALEDHKKYVERKHEEARNPHRDEPTGPALDLGFKQGQTIKVNIGGGGGRRRDDGDGGGGGGGGGFGILPPPPSASRSRGAPQASSGLGEFGGFGSAPQPSQPTQSGGFGGFAGGPPQQQQQQQRQPPQQQQQQAAFGLDMLGGGGGGRQPQRAPQAQQQPPANKDAFFNDMLQGAAPPQQQQQQQQGNVDPLASFFN